MVLYATKITPRLQYAVDLLSRELFNDPIVIITDQTTYLQYEGPHLNYSRERLLDTEFFLWDSGLLFETGIREQEIKCFYQEGYIAFFATNDDLGFDILAASFYLLSRYEEYLPHEKDQYGRYAHTNSLAYRQGFLHQPIINIWLKQLRVLLKQKFSGFYFNHTGFKFIATYDIDIAYSYLNKGWFRNLGGSVRSLINGEWKQMIERIRVLKGKQKDPYDSYEWLDALHLYCMPRAIYFFLVADQQKGYDRNIHPSNESLQSLIRYHNTGYTIGLHPSWQSGDDEQLLKEEKEMLEYIADKEIVYSRQHYIRFTLPETYRKLIKAGIEKDFSMGYGSINGFRASIASSFYWYDLEKEMTTSLKIYPFCFMDSNAYYRQQLTPRQAFDEMMHYYYSIHKVNGLMITIWHNNFLGTDKNFQDWRDVYEIFLKEAIYWER